MRGDNNNDDTNKVTCTIVPTHGSIVHLRSHGYGYYWYFPLNEKVDK